MRFRTLTSQRRGADVAVLWLRSPPPFSQRLHSVRALIFVTITLHSVAFPPPHVMKTQLMGLGRRVQCQRHGNIGDIPHLDTTLMSCRAEKNIPCCRSVTTDCIQARQIWETSGAPIDKQDMQPSGSCPQKFSTLDHSHHLNSDGVSLPERR